MKEIVGVIGLGYVGLPLAVEFGKIIETWGFDLNKRRVNELADGKDLTLEVSESDLREAEKLNYTNDINDLKGCNYFIVAVPTPIDSSNRPDLSPIINSTRDVAKVVSKGDTIIYESTVYPGVTEEICVPILEEETGLKLNEGFFIGYSPERVVPGDKDRTLVKITKVTSGSNEETAERVDQLYKKIIKAGTHKAASIKIAEAAKVIENTQRDVNIAIINELALIFDTMDIDTRAVLEAAGTKWNFLKFHPGLVGGHCIGVDPYYLTFKAEELGYRPNLILAARQLNNSISNYIAEKTVKLLIQNQKKIYGANVLVLGITFKENCPDLRNTKVTDIIDKLEEYNINVDIHDPWVDPDEEKKNFSFDLIPDPFSTDKKYDAVIAAVNHKQFVDLKMSDYEKISAGSPVIVDVKGMYPYSTWRL